MRTERADINQLLMQMRSLKTQAQAGKQQPEQLAGVQQSRELMPNGVSKTQQTPGFGDMFASAVNKVNDLQKQSGQLSKAYEIGDPNVSLSQVMIASQKASVAFQATTQVRNKLISAYEDIMNMPI